MVKPSAKTIRILLIDDHALFRESVARLLQAEPGFEVVADCSSGAEALRVLKSREVDIVLLDLDLGSERGGDFLESFRTERLNGKVLLVTAGVNDSEVPAFIRKGISGILMKHSSPALLIQGIRDAMEGKALFDRDLLQRAMESAEQHASQQSRAKFTERERTVLSSIFEGLANKQIADRLQISESAVKACLQQLFVKTGVRTRSQLVRIALEQYRDQL
ncbi:MAG TPA: response regulator transcription factor [Candidatus Sulfotelmatobacter sp.]|nr:response regulator transcription factor [Candidatus Sulfotelmatobacter sp.]